MPTFIKTGFWEKAKKGYKDWLNLDDVIKANPPTLDAVLTAGNTSTKFLEFDISDGSSHITLDAGGMTATSSAGDLYIQYSTPTIDFIKISTGESISIGKSIVASTINLQGNNTFPIYENNTAARNAGFFVGDVYRTSTGQLMITY